MVKELKQVLAESVLFQGIPEDELGGLISCLSSKVHEYGKNEYIAIEDESFEGIGFVLSGEVTVIKENVSGNRTILANLKAGDFFGEIIAFSGVKTWPSTVLSLTESRIIFINPDKVLGYCSNACDSHKILLTNIARIVAQKTLILNKKVEYLTIKSMKGKLSKYLLEEYKKNGSLTFTMPLNREKLAEFLNVSRPSMSRELCNMRDAGIIEFYRESVKIIDLKALIRLIET